MSVKLYKNGDSMSVWTDAVDEDAFVDEFVDVLSALIDENKYENDWEFQLRFWLPQFNEICNTYKGYKTEVKRQMVLVAGQTRVNENDLVTIGGK